MGMCALGDIFQAKAGKLLGGIEGVKTYIHYLLVLRKDKFSKHIEYLKIIFGRLCVTVIKSNAPKCSFGL